MEEKGTSVASFVTVNFAAKLGGMQIHHRNNTMAPNPKGTGVNLSWCFLPQAFYFSQFCDYTN